MFNPKTSMTFLQGKRALCMKRSMSDQSIIFRYRDVVRCERSCLAFGVEKRGRKALAKALVMNGQGRSFSATGCKGNAVGKIELIIGCHVVIFLRYIIPHVFRTLNRREKYTLLVKVILGGGPVWGILE